MHRLLLAALLFAASVASAQTFQASQFGPFTSEKADHAPVIRQAIQAAEKAGGGVVTLPPGSYWVAVDPSGTALEIPAGVTLDLTGAELRLIENDRRGYQVVLFSGRGKPSGLVGGRIVGDRDRHLGTDGEWGMCISVRGAIDVAIRGTKVFDCWGDGVYVGAAAGSDPSPARRITIEDVEAGHNRRNNISVVAAVGFRIARVHLHNARGTPPEAGIDLEPNAGDVVEDGEILDLVTERNASYGFAMDGNVGTVRRIAIDRVRSHDNGASGFLLRAARELRVGSMVSARNKRHALSIVGTSDVTIESLHAQDNAGFVLYTNTATGVTLGRVTFSGTAAEIQPMRIDPRSSVKVVR